MKILSVTGGAANMYCGSCMRDNALAAELIRQGHDVILLPFYTPTRTDEPNVSAPRVFFGGISVYLQQYSALFRKAPRFVDRLIDSPALIRMFAGRGIRVDPAPLAQMTVSMLEGRDGLHRRELDKLLDWLRSEPQPDVVTLPYTLLIAMAKPIREVIGRPVVCGLQGEELFLEGLPEPWRSRSLELIRSQVPDVDAFIAVSRYSAGFMSSYFGIPANKIHVVPLSINLEGHGLSRRVRPEHPVIGYLARIAPEKGLHHLVEAFRVLSSLPGASDARLEVAGYLAPENREYLQSIQNDVRAWGLSDRFRYLGELDRAQKINFLRSIAVLSVPCDYHEPKGLFLLEAMANGTPVVQPARGSFPEILEETGGGILVPPNSPEALAEGLLRLIADPDLAERLGRAGQEHVHRHRGIGPAAERTLEVYRRVASPELAVRR
jgi:glycosyltransferase involved in cell wall biosynthesis